MRLGGRAKAALGISGKWVLSDLNALPPPVFDTALERFVFR